ncbi:MAG: flagellar M-ring protein FliF [Succinivibrio sp.]|nr:flagellar M-ring protein FliF [Succinivibrio sp.]
MSDNNLPVATGQPGLEHAPVPTEDSSTALTAVPDDGVEESTESAGEVQEKSGGTFGSVREFFKSGETVRRLIILGFLVIFVAAIIFTIVSFQTSSKPVTERTLGTYTPQEIGKVLDFLDLHQYTYRMTGNDTIVVPVSEYSEITEQLLRNGIALPPDKADEGDGILMQDQGFGVSQRMESERLKHGREIQLARAIERIDGIDHATVLLAIPRENVFARQQSHPSAAVVVTLKQNAYLSPENVNSIRFMVASSVHNLMSKDVTVTDQNGRLLSAEAKVDSAESKLQRDFEMRTMREAQYRDKLDSILAPMLGLGNYSAEVDVTLDTTVQEETSQLYNPDSQAVRSETLSEKTGNDEKGNPYGVPGSLSNQPPANSAIPQELKDGSAGGSTTANANRKESREAVRNYEVDTTVRHTVRPTNIVQRLTVSVAVDYVRKVDADGYVTYTPRTEEDILKIADLVRGGLGLNEGRGDVVHVETVSFPHADDVPPLPWYQQEYFYRLVRIGGAVLVILILVLFVIRPMLNKLLHKEDLEEAQAQEDLDESSALEGNDELNLIAENSELADQVYTINQEGGIELPNLHKEADLLKAVRTLASNEPQLTAEVVKSWIDADLAKEKA